MFRLRFVGVLLCWLLTAVVDEARADVVAPADRVVSHVVIRSGPSTQTEPLGELRPGETLDYLGEVPSWNIVAMPTGETGYVSKGWTLVIPDPAAAAVKMHVVDVGTGLALFLEGEDFTLVYDGGSKDDRAQGAANRLLAYLRAARPDLTVIDHIILSHPHQDHLELLPDLFDAYNVRHVWDSGRVNDTCGYLAFLDAVANEPGATYHDAIGGPGVRSVTFDGCASRRGEVVELNQAPPIPRDPVRLGSTAQMIFLHADGEDHGNENENSLVIRLDIHGVRILLMGDAEAGGREDPTQPPSPDSIEGKLLACCEAELRANALVVGHHGSMTSSRHAFLDAVRAQDFIISSGPTSYSGVVLPDQIVVDALADRGTVWRTDRDDAACRANPAKIGRDRDQRPGGCDNILLAIDGVGVEISYSEMAD